MKVGKFANFLILLLSLRLSNANNGTYDFGMPDKSVTVEEEKEKGDDKQVWKKFKDRSQEFVNNLIRQSLPVMIRVNSDSKMSRECSTAFYQLTFGLQNMKSWAMRMLDSSGRPPAGVLDGSFVDYGDYDECLNVVVKDERQNEEKFRGHYCRINIHPLLPKKVPRLTHNTPVLDFSNFTKRDSVLRDIAKNGPMFYLLWFQYGLCVPSLCTEKDIQEVMNVALKESPMVPEVVNCQKKEPIAFSTTQLIITGIFSGLGLLLILATIFDVIKRRGKAAEGKDISEPNKLHDCILAFSLWTNWKKLLDTKPSTDNLGVINGLRCLTMTWIVLIHTYGFINRYAMARLQEMKNSLDEIPFQIISNSWLSVDTFFLIGGVVVTHSTLKSMDKTNGSLNVIRHAVRRYWRLTPPVAAALGFILLFPLFGSGPAWPEEIIGEANKCKKRWWGPLFGVNTWVNKNDMCMYHTWYVSADIHYYLAAPFILIPLYKWKTLGLILIILFTLASMVTTAVITALHDYYPTILYLLPDEDFTIEMLDQVYSKPYTHVGSYCAGMLIGYLILRHRDHKLKPIYQLLGWIAAIACNFGILFGTYNWSRGYLPDTATAVIYAAVHRTGWALTVGWLVFICATGHGGILNRFMSWKPFLPLSRLCYCVYLIHFLALNLRNGFRRQRFFFSHFDFVYEFFGNLLMSTIMAVVAYLAFEAPFSALDPIIFPKPKPNFPKTVEIPKIRTISDSKGGPRMNGINGRITSIPDSTCL
ncbi:nose resistant to fluoxetine protein 6-like [Centruroides sculpturatus]|uniref:nose resistant to fluoxetine protein 6-like n=1 Tax=Centruroides sculpturatus TaxID=218467 RepID=UPI000C6EB521|nr:nose resistant to fluoxetine protein 6-like [Centruroides sculpturatus]XP_023232401.1 nose resistant to fluoxetine protein 6-like [Centruroides sculpturatus]